MPGGEWGAAFQQLAFSLEDHPQQADMHLLRFVEEGIFSYG